MSTEHRVVCSRFGTQGHSNHNWSKPDEKKAIQTVIDLNHHADINPDHFYAQEAPYRIQQRSVTAWEDSDE